VRGRKDLNDYQPSLSAEGGYAYVGEYYVPVLRGKQLLLHKLMLCFLSMLQALCVYVMGRTNSPGFRQFYMMLPFLALVFFTGRGVVSAFSLFTWHEAMTKRQYRASEKPFVQSQRILLFLCALLLLTELIFLLIDGSWQGERFVLLMVFVLTGLSLLSQHILARMPSVKQAQGKALDTEVRLQRQADDDEKTQEKTQD
jgi:hypothetical protein